MLTQSKFIDSVQLELPEIIYILGTGRCGTTFLDVMLGQQLHLWTMGEVHYLHRWLTESKICGCGSDVSRCDFWNEILDEVGAEVINTVGLLRYPPHEDGKALRWEYVWRFLLGVPCTSTKSYTAANRILFRAIASHASRLRGGRIAIVDASKDGYRLQMLKCDGKMSIRVIYIWRNPVGFVSNMVGHMKRRSIAKVLRYSVRWVVENVFFLSVIRRLDREKCLLIHFDEFIPNFENEFPNVVSFCGGTFDKAMTTSTREILNHGISGNAPRHDKQKIRLPARGTLSMLQAITVNLITWPLQLCLRHLTVKSHPSATPFSHPRTTPLKEPRPAARSPT